MSSPASIYHHCLANHLALNEIRIAHCSAAQIHRRNLLALVAELTRERQTSRVVDCFLISTELLRCRSASRRTWPACELLVACLCVAMANAVHFLNSCAVALVLEATTLLYIGQVFWNETATSCKTLYAV